MTPPLPQPSPPDWREQLVEAIRRRDGHLAAGLAQKCVHRYGMARLETLLEELTASETNGSEGEDGDARSWLFPLLTPSSPTPEPPTPEPPNPEQPTPEQPTPEPSPGPHQEPLQTTLDEVFAPLEVAFPPLPRTENELPLRPEFPPLRPSPQVGPSPDVRLHNHLQQDPNDERPEDRPGDPESTDESDSFPIPGTDLVGIRAEELTAASVASSLSDPASLGLPLEEEDDGEAAPVPTFQPEESGAPPSSRRPKRTSGRSALPPAPIPPGLEPWVVWLPGAFRSRQRS